MPEVNFFGIYVPVLVPMALLAAVSVWLLRGVFARVGLYRLFWRPALVDLVIFLLCLAALVALYAAIGIPKGGFFE